MVKLARLAGAEAFYVATERFREECLRNGGSLFTPGAEIWAPRPVAALHERVVANPDLSKGEFLEKLIGQLTDAPGDAVQLAAEILYVILLPQDRDPAPRQQQVEDLLALSATPVPLPAGLTDALEGRIATYGAALVHKYWHFAFMLEFAKHWVSLDRPQRQLLLENADEFQSFVSEVPQKSASSQVEALKHVVFPDAYEPIVSVDVKRRIAKAFAGHAGDETLSLDKRLAAIRARLAGDHGSAFTFYDADLKNQWDLEPEAEREAPASSAPDDAAAAWLFQANTETWDVIGALEVLPTLQWVTRQSHRQIKVGDSVHFWLSGPNGGVLARGHILTPPTRESQSAADAVFSREGEFIAPERRVWIAVDRVLRTPISRAELVDHPVVGTMEIFKFPNATNFRLAPDVEAALTALENAHDGRDVEPEKLFLITAANDRAAKHFQFSLRDGIPLEQFESASAIYPQLERHAIDGRVFAWGARPGDRGEKKWERLNPGDVCLVYANGGFPLWARVYAKIRSATLAEAIWGELDGEIWECMYFLSPVEPLNAELAAVVAALDYKETHYPRGFEIVREEIQVRLRRQYPTLLHFVRALGSPAEPAERKGRFDLAELELLAEEAGLKLPGGLLSQILGAIRSGKHVILTGPPGTAKTTLAQLVAEAARRAGLCTGFVPTTATSDWTTYETIGGLRPTADQTLEFQPGHFLSALENDEWLVIDELNRSNFDRAFGQLFTVLSGQTVVLPHERAARAGPITLLPAGADRPVRVADVVDVPANWRIVATMNVFDKTLLFEMSYALMRRFAFVEVPSPDARVFAELIVRWADGSDLAATVAKALLAVRSVKDIGPAVYRDITRYVLARQAIDAPPRAQLVFDAFYSFLLPQFEGIDEDQGRRLRDSLSAALDPSDRPRLTQTLNTVLGLELGTGAARGDSGRTPLEDTEELYVETDGRRTDSPGSLSSLAPDGL